VRENLQVRGLLRPVKRQSSRLVRRLRRRTPDSVFQVDPATALAQATPGPLTDLFFAHDGRLIHKWVHYLEIYERHLSAYRQGFPLSDGTRRPLRVLEIGVSQGGSLQLWRKYFGPEATIFGIDVDPRCAALDHTETSVRIGSQADAAFLSAVVAEMGGVDIVIDDGSHRAQHQRASFDALFPELSFGGLYIAEDLHTAYWVLDFSGGYRRPGTFIEVSKSLVDGMHAWYHRWPISRRARRAQSEIFSVSFYDSVVVIEKRHRGRPSVVKVGRPSFAPAPAS
jgi:hypothetical protein